MAKAKIATSSTETVSVASTLERITGALVSIDTRLSKLENTDKVETAEKAKAKVARANAAKPESIPVLTEEHANGKPITYRLPSYEANKTQILDAFRNKSFDKGCEELLKHLPDTNDKVAYNIEYNVKQHTKAGKPTMGKVTVWLNVIK